MRGILRLLLLWGSGLLLCVCLGVSVWTWCAKCVEKAFIIHLSQVPQHCWSYGYICVDLPGIRFSFCCTFHCIASLDTSTWTQTKESQKTHFKKDDDFRETRMHIYFWFSVLQKPSEVVISLVTEVAIWVPIRSHSLKMYGPCHNGLSFASNILHIKSYK